MLRFCINVEDYFEGDMLVEILFFEGEGNKEVFYE